MKKTKPPIGGWPRGGGEFWFRGVHGTGVEEYLDMRMKSTQITSGTWAVVAEFDGPWHAWRMAEAHACDLGAGCVIPLTPQAQTWSVPPSQQWAGAMDPSDYIGGVRRIHELIDAGELQQVNLCRVLSAPFDHAVPARDVSHRLRLMNPAPYQGWFDLPPGPGPGMWLVSASPELAGDLRAGRLRVSPIKGTAPRESDLLPKDYVENRLVSRALREELAHTYDRARIVDSCAVEQHPGMVQLVSTVEADLGPGAPDWRRLMALLTPPLSVLGVPRPRAGAVIEELEPSPRGPYCGVSGWIDATSGSAMLGATIRSFWREGGRIKFGTGAGITRGSDPAGEWAETVFKADQLIAGLAAGG